MLKSSRFILLCLALGLAGAGCRRPAAPPPDGGATSSRAKKARQDAETLALGAVTAGAAAQVKAGAVAAVPPPPPPRPGPAPAIHARVSGPVHATEAEADEAAVAAAAEAVESRLAELDAPVRHAVSPAEARAHYLRAETRAARTGPTGVSVAYDVELTDEQVRELRTRERLPGVFAGVGAVAGLALVCALSLRPTRRAARR